MKKRLQSALRYWLLAPCCLAQTPPGLLWIRCEVSSADRSAMVQRLAGESALAFTHLDDPLRGAIELDAAQSRQLQSALSAAVLVRVDAPHASVEARLRGLIGAQAERAPGSLLWLPAGAAASELAALDTAARMRAYLQAGGARNLRHAVLQARAQIDGSAAPDLPPPEILPASGVYHYHPDAPGLLPNAAALERWRQQHRALRDRPAVALLLHRQHFVDGSTAWIDDWLRIFQVQCLFAYAAFAQPGKAQTLTAELPSLRRWVDQVLPRPGPVAVAGAQTAPQSQAAASPARAAMGVLLERQRRAAAQAVARMAAIVALLLAAFLVLAGAAWQARRPSIAP